MKKIYQMFVLSASAILCTASYAGVSINGDTTASAIAAQSGYDESKWGTDVWCIVSAPEGVDNITLTMDRDLKLSRLVKNSSLYPKVLTVDFGTDNHSLSLHQIYPQVDDVISTTGDMKYVFKGDGTVNFAESETKGSFKFRSIYQSDGTTLAKAEYDLTQLNGVATANQMLWVYAGNVLKFNKLQFSNASQNIEVEDAQLSINELTSYNGLFGSLRATGDSEVDISSSTAKLLRTNAIQAFDNSIVKMNLKNSESLEADNGIRINANDNSTIELSLAASSSSNQYTVGSGATFILNNTAVKNEVRNTSFADGANVKITTNTLWLYKTAGNDSEGINVWGASDSGKTTKVELNLINKLWIIRASLDIGSNTEVSLNNSFIDVLDGKLTLNGNNKITSSGSSQADSLKIRFSGENGALILGANNDISSLELTAAGTTTISLNGNKFSFESLSEFEGAMLFLEGFEDGLVSYRTPFGYSSLSINADGSLKYIKGLVGGQQIDLWAVENSMGTYDIVSAIPEPATYAIILTIFTLIFVAYHRRK